jgi:uncharacterized protein
VREHSRSKDDPNQPRHRIAATLDSAHPERPRCGRSRCAGALGPLSLAAYAYRIYTVRVNTWDERKRRRNLKDHGIDFADLEGFFDGDLLSREDTREAYGEERYQSVGVFNGVPLFVVWTPLDDEGEMTHLISARKAENHEYKAWLARYTKR